MTGPKLFRRKTMRGPRLALFWEKYPWFLKNVYRIYLSIANWHQYNDGLKVFYRKIMTGHRREKEITGPLVFKDGVKTFFGVQNFQFPLLWADKFWTLPKVWDLPHKSSQSFHIVRSRSIQKFVHVRIVRLFSAQHWGGIEAHAPHWFYFHL